MTAISKDEIKPGLVVHLDTTEVRTQGGSLTNAELLPAQDRAVTGPHQFLVVSVDDVSQSCLAVPLFSNKTSGNRALARKKMSGSYPEWINGHYHFSQWQHWRIPLDAFVVASVGELSQKEDRCTYAASDQAALESIANWANKNRAPFRAP